MTRIFILLGIIIREPGFWVGTCLSQVPGYIGMLLRRKYWSCRLRSCGKNMNLGYRVTIEGAKNIEIGDRFVLGANSYLGSQGDGHIKIGTAVATNRNVMLFLVHGRIVLGNNVLIGPNVVIISDNHIYERLDIPIRDQGISTGEIVIEDDVWIGANAVILPDVRVGKGTVIAAGAVVAKNIPPYSIAVGIPAKVTDSRIIDS